MAFEGGNYAKTIRELPYKIIPGEVAKYRQNILVERAVVSERIRLAIGLPLRNVSEYEPTDAYLEDSLVAEKYYDPPLINIISFACNACPTKRVQVTNHLHRSGQELHRPGEVHQVRQVCRRVPLRRHPEV